MYLYLIYEYIVVSLILEDRSILAQAEAPAGFVSVAATTQIFFSFLHFLIDFNELASRGCVNQPSENLKVQVTDRLAD